MPYATYRNQPLKGLFLVYQLISTLLVRIPYWVIFNIPSPLRPRPTWSLKRALLVNIIRHFTREIGNQIGPFPTIADHRAIKHGEGINGIWISAVPELITGDIKSLAEVAQVAPTNVPGYWQYKKGAIMKVDTAPQQGEKVVLNFHGGSYVRMSAHPTDPTANIVKGILKHVASVQRVLSVEYRLSSSEPFKPVNPFPAALIDALAGYNHLIDLGFSPSDIIICGDSAGGNLAQALTRYLVENERSTDAKIPAPPGALILLSPWSEMSRDHDKLPGGGSILQCENSDYLNSRDGGVSYDIRSFLGPHGKSLAETSAYISPASLQPGFAANFKNFPRTFLNGGGAEILIDQIHTLRDRMVKDLGEGNGVQSGEGKVRYHEAQDAVHDYLVFNWHEPERTDTLKAIAQWVDA